MDIRLILSIVNNKNTTTVRDVILVFKNFYSYSKLSSTGAIKCMAFVGLWLFIKISLDDDLSKLI